MDWLKLATGLVCVATAVNGRRSLQHVGKRDPVPKSTIADRENALEHFLATRQVPAPKFANANTTSKKPSAPLSIK